MLASWEELNPYIEATIPDIGYLHLKTDPLSRKREYQQWLYHAAEETTRLLAELGIPMHVHGYHYLIDAVYVAVSIPEMSTNLSQQLYPCIARRYHTSASRVERSIRHAIELAWKRGSLAAVNGLFGRSLNLAYEKPTNGEMIALLTEKVRIRLYLETMLSSEQTDE